MGSNASKTKDLATVNDLADVCNGGKPPQKKKLRSKSFNLKSCTYVAPDANNGTTNGTTNRTNGTNGHVNGDCLEQVPATEQELPVEQPDEQPADATTQKKVKKVKSEKVKAEKVKAEKESKENKHHNHNNGKSSFWSRGKKNGTSMTDIDQINGNEKLKEVKVKSKSSSKLGSLARSQSLKKSSSNKTLGNSVMNLRRVNSLRQILGREKRKKKNQHPAEECELGECHFEKLYADQIHLNIFRFFTLKEKVHLRGVCEKWDRELFLVQNRIRYPLFVPPANDIQLVNRAQFLSKKYLYFCENVRSIYVCQCLTKDLFLNLIKYLPTKRLEEIEFCINVKEKSEIIPHYLLERFSETFGSHVKRLKLKMARPKVQPPPPVIKDGKEVNSNDNVPCDNISGVILQMLCLCSSSYINLVHLELTITNRLIQKYLTHLWDYKYQLKTLSLKLCIDTNEFVQLATESVKFIVSFKRLLTLDIAICPVVNASPIMVDGLPKTRPRQSRITNLSVLTDEVGQLSKLMLDSTVRQLSLSINISHIDCGNLDLVRPLAMFTNLKSLSLKVYDNRKIPPEDLLPKFDFTKLAAITELAHLTVAYSNLTAANVEQLIESCPKLTDLELSCDVRLNSIAVNAIVKHSLPLRSLLICGLQSTTPLFEKTENEEEELKEIDDETGELVTNSLITDTEALGKLLKITSLRRIRMENCRVDVENCSVLFNLRQFTAFHQREMFEISVVKNQIPLILPSKFYQKYDEFIPPNLKFYLC